MKTRDRRRDPTLMLVIFAVLVDAFALRAISNLSITLTPSMLAALIPSLAMVALSMCALALLRLRSTATTLRDRVSIAVVPADEFDPDAEAVLRFAAQLARLDRTVRGWLDRRASAIRIRLEADGEGRLAYLLKFRAARASCCVAPSAATRASSCAGRRTFAAAGATRGRVTTRPSSPPLSALSWCLPAQASNRWDE